MKCGTCSAASASAKRRIFIFRARSLAGCARGNAGGALNRPRCPTAMAFPSRSFRLPAPTRCLRAMQLLPVTIFKNDDEPVYGPQIISPRTAQQVRSMLEAVVSPEGTAPLAQIPGYRAGGKTGTAYKYTGRGYDKSKYRASFVGIAPMSA